MKKNILVLIFCSITFFVLAQTKPGSKQKPPSQSDMDKMMEEATKGMSKEEKAEMQKMMQGMMPDMSNPNAKIVDYPLFTSNNELVPEKDNARINAIPKKKLVQADMSSYSTNMYNKLLVKGAADEIVLVKKIIAQSPKANDLGGAAILCMQQGHSQAAMALSMKAVIAEPANPNWQNNMASLLIQYGYPEQAIPILQKLRIDFPSNSTVMNNLAHAWFGLGQIDSAKTIIRIAGRMNPYHPEAEQTEGVIDETSGDPSKATDQYVESMENSINPFTEQMIKNNNGQSKFDNIDFEKLKRSITIYEYFPKDWIKIPELSDKVSGYENDMKLKNGYQKMFEDLEAKIDQLNEAAQDELQNLADKGQEAFVEEMKETTMKGLNVMSKPAITIQIVLQNYIAKWESDYIKEHSELLNKINDLQTEMTKHGDNDHCLDFDEKNNSFMDFANPLIREFHARKIEEFRCWLNAFCTWTWYIAGNPKQSTMIQCISWTAAFEKMHQAAIEDQYAEFQTCVNHDGDGRAMITTPEIPNFSCPTIVKMPMGLDFQNLGNATTNFDNNKFSVKNSGENPIPNNTIAYGADNKSIAEPGPDPFFKTANGSIAPGIAEPGNSPGENLLDILTNGPQQAGESATHAGAPGPSMDAKMAAVDNFWENYSKNKIAQQKELAAKNSENENFWLDYSKNKVNEYKNISKVSKETSDFFVNYAKDKIAKQKAEQAALEKSTTDWFKDYLKSKIEYSKTDEYKRDMEEATTSKINKLKQSKRLQELLRKLMESDCSQIKTTAQNKLDQYLKDLQAAGDGELSNNLKSNGLQPSISSGLQAPGTFAPVNGLFK